MVNLHAVYCSMARRRRHSRKFKVVRRVRRRRGGRRRGRRARFGGGVPGQSLYPFGVAGALP